MTALVRPHCSQCIYWAPDSPATTGHCHRFPPGVYASPGTGMGAQKFPTVDHHAWCGEWSDDKARLDEMTRRSMAATASRKA